MRMKANVLEMECLRSLIGVFEKFGWSVSEVWLECLRGLVGVFEKFGWSV